MHENTEKRETLTTFWYETFINFLGLGFRRV